MVMENNEEYLEFLTSENYTHQLDIWYKAYNISREKIELFHDFIISLYQIIDETYLGSDVIFTDIDQKNHYTWCWDKLISNFEKEKIFFKERGEHFNYFWSFFSEAYYYNQIKEEPIRILPYFNILFNFKLKKTRSELDILGEVYRILNQNLKK